MERGALQAADQVAASLTFTGPSSGTLPGRVQPYRLAKSDNLSGLVSDMCWRAKCRPQVSRPSRSGSVETSALRSPIRNICSRSSYRSFIVSASGVSAATLVHKEQMVLQMAAAAAAPSAPMVSAFELRTQVHPRRSRMPPAYLLSCPRSSAHDSFPAMLLPCLTRHSSSLQMTCLCRAEADPSSGCRQRLPARRYVASPATCVALTPYDAKRAMLTYVQATEPALSLLPA